MQCHRFLSFLLRKHCCSPKLWKPSCLLILFVTFFYLFEVLQTARFDVSRLSSLIVRGRVIIVYVLFSWLLKFIFKLFLLKHIILKNLLYLIMKRLVSSSLELCPFDSLISLSSSFLALDEVHIQDIPFFTFLNSFSFIFL